MNPELLEDFFTLFFIIIFCPIPIWALRRHSLQKACISNASKPCISVHFVTTLFTFASSHWESIKQNQYCLPVWFHPFPDFCCPHSWLLLPASQCHPWFLSLRQVKFAHLFPEHVFLKFDRRYFTYYFCGKCNSSVSSTSVKLLLFIFCV